MCHLGEGADLGSDVMLEEAFRVTSQGVGDYYDEK